MKRSSRLLAAASLAGLIAFGTSNVYATDMDVDATMTASAAVTLTKQSDLDFGGIDFVAVHNGTVELGPDGNAALGGGPAGLTLTGTPAAAQIDVTSSAGIIDVTCETTGVIGDGTTNLTMTTIKWDTSAATYAAATNTCAGLGAGAVSIDTGTTNNPSLYIGAELTIGANVLNGSSGSTPFNTSTGGGNPVTFRFVFQ